MLEGFKKIVLACLLFLYVFAVQAKAEEILTWQDCVKESAKNHPDLISAQENIKATEASKKVTASALYPQIDSSIGASTKKARSNKTSTTTDTYSYGVSGTQLLFDGLKTVDDVKSASEDIKAAQYNYKFTSSEVRFRLRSAFIDLLKAQELLKITEEIRKIRRSNLVLITLRYESGIEHKGALLTAEANMAQADFEINQAKRVLEVAQQELIKEMGRDKFSSLSAQEDFKISDLELEKPDFEVLAVKNPSLGKLAAEKNSASFAIKSAKADFFPQLSAGAGASRSSAHWLPVDGQWNTGLTLSLPIFEGGLRTAEVSKARALFNQAREDERSNKDSVVLILQQTWAAFKDAFETVDVQKKFLAAAEERAKISEGQYSLGIIQFDSWTIIEDNLIRTKKSFLDSQAKVLLAEAQWVQAKGEVLEYAQK